jgi:hypothetical protein
VAVGAPAHLLGFGSAAAWPIAILGLVSLGAGLAGLSAQAYIGRLKCARFRKADPKNEQWIFGEPPLACSDYHHQPCLRAQRSRMSDMINMINSRMATHPQ